MSKPKGKARAKANKKLKNKQKNSFFLRRKNLIAKIRKYDDPILEKECEECLRVPKQTTDAIFKEMVSVLNATENGVGLAAPQIGITRRMAIIKPDSDSRDITFMINPEIVESSEEMKFGREGCLSYPNTYALIERYTWVRVKYLDENWGQQEKIYKEGDILGIVIQHELEHLESGFCQVHDWWENPEVMENMVKARMASPKEQGPYEVEESEDLKREKEEANDGNDDKKAD